MAGHEGNPKAASVRVEHRTAQGWAGQRRHDLRIGPQPRYVATERSELNRVLIEPPTPSELRQLCQARRETRGMQRRMRSDTRVATTGIVTFGTDAQPLFNALSVEDQDRAFRATAQRIAELAGSTLEGLVIHDDETAIHAHFVLAGYDLDGQPVTKKLRRAQLKAAQDAVAEVMGAHCPGIERGNAKRDRLAAGAAWADVIHKSVQEMHNLLPAELAAAHERTAAEIAELEAEVEAEMAELRRSLAPVRKMSGARDLVASDPEAARAAAAEVSAKERARVEALEERGDLTEKESKRLAVYSGRLATYEAWEVDLARLIELGPELKRLKAAGRADREAAAADREAAAAERAQAREEAARDRAEMEAERKALAAEREEVRREAAELDEKHDELGIAAVTIALGQARPEPPANTWSPGEVGDMVEEAGLKEMSFGTRIWATLRMVGSLVAEFRGWPWTPDPKSDPRSPPDDDRPSLT